MFDGFYTHTKSVQRTNKFDIKACKRNIKLMKIRQFSLTGAVNDLALQIKFVDRESFQRINNYKALEKLGFEAKYKQLILLPESNSVLAGVEFSDKTKTADRYHKLNPYVLGANLYRQLPLSKTVAVQINELPGLLQNENSLRNIILGFIQASTQFTTFTKASEDSPANPVIGISMPLKRLLSGEDLKLIDSLNKGITRTRQLIDATPEEVNPSTIEKLIQDTFVENPNITIHAKNYEELSNLGAQGITYVGRASIHKPILTQVILKPKSEVKKKVVLVGKGVTYDSGGLDIKPDGHMKTMKCDMGGAATMCGTLKALAELGLEHTEVHWISAFVENMIDGSAYKPDDIITTLSGQTVEVVNTDAEGRLTLTDALTLASLENPDYIIDAATLTGACIFALTEHYTALMGNDEELNQELQSHFESEQERSQYVAMPEILRTSLAGDLSDLKNIPDFKFGGHVTAGLFLSHFINQKNFRNPGLEINQPQEYSWVHLDIAGSSYNKRNNDIDAVGSTGHGVRSLVSWIRSIDSNR